MHDMLIQQLRDIEAPNAPSVWPPAPGWWLLGIACVCLTVLLGRALIARKNRMAYRREARSTLERIHEAYLQDGDSRRYAQQAAELARRVAIRVAGRERAARPSGGEFRALLEQLSDRPLSKETAVVLSEAAYQPELDVDVDRVQRDLVAWLEALRGDARA